MCTYINVYTYMHTHLRKCTYIHIYTHVNTKLHNTYIYIYTHIHLHIYVHKCICICTDSYTQNKFIYIYTHTHTHSPRSSGIGAAQNRGGAAPQVAGVPARLSMRQCWGQKTGSGGLGEICFSLVVILLSLKKHTTIYIYIYLYIHTLHLYI